MIAVVTGASSGFGLECCKILKNKGYTVYGLSRRGTGDVGVNNAVCDISSESDVLACIGGIAKKEGGIDLLINNAGMGISGPIELSDPDDVRRITDVNFLGAYYCTKAVLPVMRAQKSGTVVFISSVAADIAIPYQAFYSTAKAAVSAFALALRNEVSDFGIKVCVVEPGDASTGFTDARKKKDGGDIYKNSEKAVKSMEKDERSGMSAEAVAKVICKTALAKNPRPVTVVGGKYKLFLLLFRLLPKRISYYIVKKMY